MNETEAKAPECKKTCGSKRCKGTIKGDKCLGAEQQRCISVFTKNPKDRVEANAWLFHGDGDREWLNNHGARAPKSHLSTAPAPLFA